ncbi:50S RIBOSOMAL PROTEIN L33 [Mycoplasmopsis pulmonis]|uniref:Large ribosomal subunit protein bL33A n=1 Tax=Mycoplasmopsis pulmonis (strain UAB CTIP) TaxID=272635 RepID=RL331_MYCPU|nr:50S ribosomal protein L33 [Mycoplasmopsis pulmonis]Q98Q77.1 RecName: Full=Large ribosomal subunit protein bL33A; AltName: Full=50S ribosomal protein L33 1 [Mycoplasmopsis pulmonis UAB CTIP]MDZ7293501.1 50S ribosomal protein L33 [Mycoplasmopsis pulmonis]CAC13662.1 50S RIBOSOMAL PROTEIN L33 [Mycoplasmopsis pulmonis]VEU68256.1 50S ribosomal protein L33 [Mycoplasmopsis pulmonis]
MAREGFTLACKECKMENYISKKNKKKHVEKLEINKFCSKCNSKTMHREKK